MKVANGIVLVAGEAIVFYKIVSTVTLGSGFAHLPCSLLPAS